MDKPPSPDTFDMLKSPPPIAEYRNYHGGFNKTIHAGYFTDYPNLTFHFPPMKFDTHQMAQTQEGWTIKIKQKSRYSRPRISVYNNAGFGFTLRVVGKDYTSAYEIFREINRTYRIEQSEHANINKVPAPIIKQVTCTRYVDRYVPMKVDLHTAIQNEIEATMARLKDWRPDKPFMENVIPIEEFLDKLVEKPKKEPISMEEMERKIAAM